uniref:MARVEL domain-containing protein n=1 Tax=Steinernema glaseri TaxID=37863 RepID=A0A1I7ZYC7_9BILA
MPSKKKSLRAFPILSYSPVVAGPLPPTAAKRSNATLAGRSPIVARFLKGMNQSYYDAHQAADDGKYWGGLINVAHESARIAYYEVFGTAACTVLLLSIAVAFGSYFATILHVLLFIFLAARIAFTSCLFYGLTKTNWRFLIPSMASSAFDVLCSVVLCVFCVYIILVMDLSAEQKKELAQIVVKSMGTTWDTELVRQFVEDFGRIIIAYAASCAFVSSATFLAWSNWKVDVLYKCHRYFKSLEAYRRRS